MKKYYTRSTTYRLRRDSFRFMRSAVNGCLLVCPRIGGGAEGLQPTGNLTFSVFKCQFPHPWDSTLPWGELIVTHNSLFLVCNHVTRRPCWGSKQKNISSKFPEERNAFVLDHQHGCCDVTCKPAIAALSVFREGTNKLCAFPQV